MILKNQIDIGEEFMKKKSILIPLVIVYTFFMSFGSVSTKASSIEGIKSIVVEKKNIIVPNYQNITISLNDNTGVSYIQVSYKNPNGSYTATQLFRNST